MAGLIMTGQRFATLSNLDMQQCPKIFCNFVQKVLAKNIPKVVERPEVVPIHYNELQETKVVLPKKNSDSVAIRLEYNGIIMAISNDADAAIIKATLTALQQLC